jgi:mediator of RNA polymerase II transcription subunit 12
MKHDKPEQEPPPIYESQPPTWLPKSHRTADVGEPRDILMKSYPIIFIHTGYPGFHPPCPGQDEDVLSDKHVKDGFLLPLPVPVSLQSINSSLMTDMMIRMSIKVLPLLFSSRTQSVTGYSTRA